MVVASAKDTGKNFLPDFGSGIILEHHQRRSFPLTSVSCTTHHTLPEITEDFDSASTYGTLLSLHQQPMSPAILAAPSSDSALQFLAESCEAWVTTADYKDNLLRCSK